MALQENDGAPAQRDLDLLGLGDYGNLLRGVSILGPLLDNQNTNQGFLGGLMGGKDNGLGNVFSLNNLQKPGFMAGG